MTYTTFDKLLARFGHTTLVQLTDRGEQATGVVDQTVVDQALADTDAAIDGSLAVRYQLPLASVPAQVADIALSIAIYKLHVFDPAQKIKDDYQQALKDLDRIATGKIRLDVAGIEPATSGSGDVIVTDRPRDFTPDNLRGFI